MKKLFILIIMLISCSVSAFQIGDKKEQILEDGWKVSSNASSGDRFFFQKGEWRLTVKFYKDKCYYVSIFRGYAIPKELQEHIYKRIDPDNICFHGNSATSILLCYKKIVDKIAKEKLDKDKDSF